MAANLDICKLKNSLIDVVFICDYRDVSILMENSTLQKLILKENLNVGYVYDEQEPGMTLSRHVITMARRSHCLVFCVSENFCGNKYLKRTTECFENNEPDQHVVALVTHKTIKLVEKFFWLTKGAVIYQTSGNWEMELMQTLKECQPFHPFSKVIIPKHLSDILQQNGMNIGRLKWEMYGVLAEMGNQILEIDLDTFTLHLDQHQTFKTSQVCGQCSELCTVDTTITIMVGEGRHSLSSTAKQSSDEIVKFCTAVLDVIEIYKEGVIWSLGCTVRGKPLGDETILKQLYLNLYYSLAEKNMLNFHKFYRPEFQDLNKRKESFSDNWPENKTPSSYQLAEAGFMLIETPNKTCCFDCGVYINDWQEKDDPWIRHAMLLPSCQFVKTHMTKEEIDKAKHLTANTRKGTSHIYESLEARINSFENFDTRHVKDFERCGKNKDTLIREYAEAGFNFSGYIDMAECFSCGLKLSSIKPNDNLFLTHARLSPKCQYVLEHADGEIVDQLSGPAGKDSGGNENKTALSFLLKTLDKVPRREWPANIFRPGNVFSEK